MMSRIKFYSISDLSCGTNLKDSENVIKEYNLGRKINDINDVIELYNIKKFFDNKLYLVDWTKDQISDYETTMKNYFKIIAQFYKKINNDSFIKIYNDLDIDYKEDFWELAVKFKTYEIIELDVFTDFMNKSNFQLDHILRFKGVVDYFGSTIKEHMMRNCLSAELLLDQYELNNMKKDKILYFPKELSSLDKEQIIINYISSDEANYNYIKLICNIQSNKDKLELAPKTLLNAKKKREELEELYFGNSGFVIETMVSFSDSAIKEVDIKMEGRSTRLVYSTKWIELNTDYPTILNNFIYLFEFVDKEMRCSFVNKFNQMGVFERFGLMNSQNSYLKGSAFEDNNATTLLQMTAYYNKLLSLNLRLEEVIEWFFEEYLSNEFNVCNFRIVMPSVNSMLIEKCAIIMPAMESALKQFSLYVEEGEIDFELLEIRSDHLIYSNIPSLADKKYVYGLGEEFRTVTYLLFSDQSGLSYDTKNQKSYKSFYKRLITDKLKIEDINNYRLNKINWLVEHNYLTSNDEGFLIFNNSLMIMILQDLYFNEVISYWRYSDQGRKILDQLKEKKIVEFENTLFSRPEQNYINYLLNKSKFNNGLDLRNKYAHTQLKGDKEDETHHQNYMIFLRLFILTIIKINEEFCTADEFGWLK